MNRRSFFSLLGAAAPVYFLPPMGGWRYSPRYVYDVSSVRWHGSKLHVGSRVIEDPYTAVILRTPESAFTQRIKIYYSIDEVERDFGPQYRRPTNAIL